MKATPIKNLPKWKGDVQLWKDAELEKVPGTVEHSHYEEAKESWIIRAASCLEFLAEQGCLCDWQSIPPCPSCAAKQLLKDVKAI